MIRAALDRLAAAGVPFATRGEQPIDDPPPGGDVDILVGIGDRHRAARALEAAGFHRLREPGHRRHRFFLAFDPVRARWLKIDVTLIPRRFRWDLRARDEASLRRFAAYRVGAKARPGRLERAWARQARRCPIGVRRRGPVVAVLGPDGAGKGSVIAGLRGEIPMRVTPRYLGEGGSRGEYRPPRRDPGGGRVRRAAVAAWQLGRALMRRLPGALNDLQRGARRGLAALPPVWWSYYYAWRGDVVLCDRHPVERLAVDGRERSPGRAIERAIVRALVPRPDRIVLLDAPGELLFARKGEHSPELLEALRQGYRERLGPRATIVDAAGPLPAGVAAASAVVWEAVAERRGW